MTHKFVNYVCIHCRYDSGMSCAGPGIESAVITNDFHAENCEEFSYFVDEKIKKAPAGHKWKSFWYGSSQLRLICNVCQQEVFVDNDCKWAPTNLELIMDCEEAIMNQALK